MELLQGLSAPKAFGVGVLLMAVALKQWVFALSAVAIMKQPRPGSGSAAAFLVFVVGA